MILNKIEVKIFDTIELIDVLQIMKTLPGWTPRLETIFGNLTEKDKLKKKGEI